MLLSIVAPRISASASSRLTNWTMLMFFNSRCSICSNICSNVEGAGVARSSSLMLCTASNFSLRFDVSTFGTALGRALTFASDTAWFRTATLKVADSQASTSAATSTKSLNGSSARTSLPNWRIADRLSAIAANRAMVRTLATANFACRTSDNPLSCSRPWKSASSASMARKRRSAASCPMSKLSMTEAPTARCSEPQSLRRNMT